MCLSALGSVLAAFKHRQLRAPHLSNARIFQDSESYLYIYTTSRVTANIGRDPESLSIGEGEQFVVVQHAVEVLHPLGVHVSVEDDPLPFVQLSTHIVYDPAQIQRKNRYI